MTAGSGATYNRVNAGTPPTALSTTATAAYYTGNTFTITADGDYAVTSVCVAPTTWDNFITLYKGTFSASSPLTNAIAATDGTSTSSASLSPIHLTPGTYTVVTTGSTNSGYGSYTVTVAPVTGGGTVANYTATLMPGSGATFNRPLASGAVPPTSLSAVGTSVLYDAHPFTVATSGSYNITSACVTPSNWDNFFVIYDTTFDPTSPLTNAIAAVDGATSASATLYGLNLTAGKTYIFVTTSFNNGTQGTFHDTVFTGGGTYPPTIPDNTPAGLSLTNTVTDTLTVGSLDGVTVLGLNHGSAGDLTATLTHNGVTIELFDRIGALTAGSFGSSAIFAGDYTFAATGADISAATGADISAATGTIDPTVTYAQYLNGTAGESSTFTGDFTAFNGMSVAGDWTINVADNAFGFIGSYTGFSFTVTPSSASVSSVITFEGIFSGAGPQNVTFTFRPVGGGADIVKTASVAPTGAYTITGLPKKAMNLLIKGDKYLATLIAVDTTAGNQTGVNVTEFAADGNNDNSVDSSDFTLLIGAFNSDATIAGSGYDLKADFNSDGSVDSSDFTLLIGNFNKTGDILP